MIGERFTDRFKPGRLMEEQVAMERREGQLFQHIGPRAWSDRLQTLLLSIAAILAGTAPGPP